MFADKKLAFVSTTRIVNHLERIEGEFLERLAKELMLDEILQGEANPKDFLVEQMKSVCKQMRVEYHERRIKELEVNE